MSVGDLVAIASCLLTIGGVIFYFGKMAYRIERLERDVNGLGGKLSSQNRECEERLERLDKRADNQATFLARVDQRMIYVEERLFGEDTIARIRGMDS